LETNELLSSVASCVNYLTCVTMRMDSAGMLKSLFMSSGTATSSAVYDLSPRPSPSLLDSCHKKIRLIGGAPVAFLGGLVA